MILKVHLVHLEIQPVSSTRRHSMACVASYTVTAQIEEYELVDAISAKSISMVKESPSSSSFGIVGDVATIQSWS